MKLSSSLNSPTNGSVLVQEEPGLCIAFCLSKAYPDTGAFGLGSFQIAVNDLWYGVKGEEATLLACSRDEMRRRIRSRGTHTADYADASAEDIANAYVMANFGSDNVLLVRNIERELFLKDLFDSGIQWAPDGDEAFDDGSYILQFDLGDLIRVIAFRYDDRGMVDLSEVRLSSAGFYLCLERACEEMMRLQRSLLEQQKS